MRTSGMPSSGARTAATTFVPSPSLSHIFRLADAWSSEVRDRDIQSAERVRGVVVRQLRDEQCQESRAHAQDRGAAWAWHLRGALLAREHLLLCVCFAFSIYVKGGH